MGDIELPSIEKQREKWKRFNVELEKLIRENDFWRLGATYYEMADFLKSEGKDESKLRELGYKMKSKIADESIEDYRKSDVVTGVEIIATKDSCVLCKELNGRIFTWKEVLSLKPLPVKDCTYPGGCRCVYGPVVE